MNTKKRVEEIDILKALAIIGMVAGHSGVPITKFICLFHMAVFFMASGYFFRDYSSNSIDDVYLYIKGKIRQLWFPYFVWNAIYVLMNNAFIALNIYTDNESIFNYVSGKNIKTHQYITLSEMIKKIVKGLYFSNSTTMGGAFWFLKILFMVSICYVICDYLVKKCRIKNSIWGQLVISLLLLLFGYLCSLNNHTFKGIALMASYYCLYYVGHLLFLIRDKYEKFSRKEYTGILLTSGIILCILNRYGYISLNSHHYENPVFLLVSSICGWWFLFALAFLIKFTCLKMPMMIIGKRTLSIVILHFVCMKLVAIVVCWYYKLPLFCMAAHPNIYGDKGLWWLLYTVVGTLVPVGLSIMYEKTTGRIKAKISI